MQLLTISVYNSEGQRRDVDFDLNALNIISGDAQTGKTSLLDIVEYCLGRATPQVPFGAITRTVTWYAVLLQFEGTRVVAARPAPEPGKQSQDRAMLVVGAELVPLDADDLHANMDRRTLRRELGRLLGIDEVSVGDAEADPDSVAVGLRPNVAHAALLCLQSQSEIANRSLLFHRTDDEQIRLALRDTLPYFLGAIAADQVMRRQELLEARRALRAAQAALAAAERAGQAGANRLRELVEEAYGAGLIPRSDYTSRDEALAALQAAVHVRGPARGGGDTEILLQQRDELRRQLRRVNEQRRLLEEQIVAGEGYGDSLRVQQGRLRSLRLIPDAGATSSSNCPLCTVELTEPDPTLAELQQSVLHLSSQLADLTLTQPRQAAALSALEADAAELRERVITIEGALGQLSEGGRDAGGVEEAAFRRGRVHALLAQLTEGGAARQAAAAADVDEASRRVNELADVLDSDEELAQVNSRLRLISDTMSALASQLDLEHGGSPVRLEGRRLTVVIDTDDGPVPLQRIGSGANWMGYHVVAHLALHQYFVEKARPVPRFLMLDQPTQAYYPPGVAAGTVATTAEGLPEDADSEAVRALFLLLRRVTGEDAHGLQIIVTEHAMLDEPWYLERVKHVWRDGDALIPKDWLVPREQKGDDEPLT